MGGGAVKVRRTVRRLAKGAGIAFLAGTLGGAALLAAEIVAARSRTYAKPDLGLTVRGATGAKGRPAPADGSPRNLRELRLILLGDATALGVGADTAEQTLGGHLARMLGDAGAAVALSTVAVAGARSADLATQVARAQLGATPDLAAILVGMNDVTHLVRPGEAAAALATAVRRLRDGGTAVVVGTCPDLGAARAIAPPLRQLFGWYGRRIARAQAAAARAAGATVIDLGGQVGPVFRADAGMLCRDGLHPSADGYRVIAYALFPALADAADLPSSITD
jgi:lysophospholipase L1-like esterase